MNRAQDSPEYPLGYAEPDLKPLHPQRKAEVMGGRIPMAPDNAVTPRSLKSIVISVTIAAEIGLTEDQVT
jgi:hypothetical protein